MLQAAVASTRIRIPDADARHGCRPEPINSGRNPFGPTRMHEVTQILSAIEQGDPHAPEQLLPLVYEALRKLATQRLAQESPGQTLQATALVHEVYLRLVGSEK